MRNFKNKNRRKFRNNSFDRNLKLNVNDQNLSSNLGNISDFRKKNYPRNNFNFAKLIQKYSDMAREALSSGDKILYENYMQHAEHFIRNTENGVNKTNGFNEKKNELKSVNEANINKFKQEDIKQEEETQVKES